MPTAEYTARQSSGRRFLQSSTALAAGASITCLLSQGVVADAWQRRDQRQGCEILV